MNKKLVLLTATLILIVTSISAQKAIITFAEKEYDFGQVNEQGGKVTHVFEFTNTGNAPLVVQNVQASCGCTTPEWTKEPIAPGKKGVVSVSYNPLGRPNSFTKPVTVRSNASNEQEIIYIKGNVVSQGQAATNNFAFQMGGALGYSAKSLSFFNVVKSKSQTATLNVKNISGAPIKVEASHLPSYISVVPVTLNPGEEKPLIFTFNSNKASVWGPVNDDIYLMLNGKKVISDEYKIGIAANITDDFNNQSAAEKRNAPIFEVKSTNVFLGDISKGHIVRGRIEIKNVGVNPLEIRRIVNNNGELSFNPNNLEIRGGKTSTLKVDLNTKILDKGEYKKVVTLQTNDPMNQYVMLIFTWNVK